ncbi:MAG: dihydroorotase [Bdellovibrionia bacterium]
MSLSSLLIQNGRILDPSENRDHPGDLLIEEGKIVAIDSPGKIPSTCAQKRWNAQGLWITPGLIDVHVHFREPGFEYKETIESGSQAAVTGGFTSVACMANTQPVNDSAETTHFIRTQAQKAGLCRVFPIGAVTQGLQGLKLADLEGMVRAGARALSDDGMPVMNSQLMREAMERAKALGVPVISHAEDLHLVNSGVMNEGAVSRELQLRGNPAAAEEILVAREIALCRLTQAPVHLAHLSTQVALEHLRRAREAGLPVTAEVCPHHLFLTDEAVRTQNTHFKMAPPLRTENDVKALRAALAENLIQILATDHAPHSPHEKQVHFSCAPNGILGLQTAVPLTLRLVHEGSLPLQRWVESLTSAPARLLGVPLGTLKLGSMADLTLIDPHHRWQLQESDIVSKSWNSPFFGWKFEGKVAATLVNGNIVFQSGHIQLEPMR